MSPPPRSFALCGAQDDGGFLRPSAGGGVPSEDGQSGEIRSVRAERFLRGRDVGVLRVHERGMQRQLPEQRERAQDGEPVVVDVVEQAEHLLPLPLQVRLVQLAVPGFSGYGVANPTSEENQKARPRGVTTYCSVFLGVISLPSLKVLTTTSPRWLKKASRKVGFCSMVSARA